MSDKDTQKFYVDIFFSETSLVDISRRLFFFEAAVHEDEERFLRSDKKCFSVAESRQGGVLKNVILQDFTAINSHMMP